MINLTYFCHGTTTDNENNISSGRSDAALSDLWYKQWVELRDKIKETHFDFVFCSDLQRAAKSAELTFQGKVPILHDRRLRECNYGINNWHPSEIVEPLQEKNLITRFPEGESYEDVRLRVQSFLADLKAKFDNCSIALVSHKAPQLALEVLLKNKTWEQAFAEDRRKTKAWQPGRKFTLGIVPE